MRRWYYPIILDAAEHFGWGLRGGSGGKRKEGNVFIPFMNEHLRGLPKMNQGMAAFTQKYDPKKIATLDQDTTMLETAKRDALFSYKWFKSYQPLNTSDWGLA